MAFRASDIVPLSEEEHANLVLVDDAITGLRQALAGKFVPDEELDRALGLDPAGSREPQSRRRR